MQNNRLECKETAFRLFLLARCKRSVSDRAARLDAQAHTMHTYTHTHARMYALRRNTSRQRNNYIGENPLMYPEISASLSVSLPEFDAKARTRNRRFFDFEKTKKKQKGKKRKK